MTREWKPGDVAMVPGPGRALLLDTGMWVTQRVGNKHDSKGFSEFLDVRPLVVIDPENREDIERLLTLYTSGLTDRQLGAHSALTWALREYADPPAPKPDEPQGLGAVIEDTDGKLWIRNEGDDETDTYIWRHGAVGRWSEYTDIDVARKLSEGWSA